MVTTDSPNSEIERSATRCGMLLSAFSTGMVTKRSTSSAACPGQSVITCAWMLVTSGYASIGSRVKAATAAATNTTMTTSAMGRCRST